MLLLGVLSAKERTTREVKIQRRDATALLELARRGAEVEQARRQVEAVAKKLGEDTAQIHSEIRTAYGISEHEEMIRVDGEKLVLVVQGAPKAAPVGTK